MKMLFLMLLLLLNDNEGAHATQGCGSVVNNILKCPGYPNYNYPPNTDCSYTIHIPHNLTMKISFIDFDLGNDSSCDYDYLEIVKDGRRVGKYCGYSAVQSNRLTGHRILITFLPHDDIVQRFTAGSHGEYPGNEVANFKESMFYIVSGIAFVLLLVLCFVLGIWCYRRSHHKRIKRSSRSFRKIIPLDKWELLPEQIEHEEELGRGAFGVVYKATLKRRIGIEAFDTEKTLKPEEPCQMVAVKKLQDDPSEDQKEEFLHEIEQMKLLGAHQNIVSLVGCCTLQEHKFLVIEYVPFGDLLQWLRRRRRSINRNQGTGGNEEKKCYEDKEIFSAQKELSGCDQDKDDTWDEIDQDQPLLEQTLLMMESTPSRDNIDIITDANPFSASLAEENRNDFLDQNMIELMPIPSTSQENSKAVAIFTSTENIDDDDEEEADSFTTQKLFSFAWQIAKGMNHLAEKGFIHRDLAARNILVGSDNRVKVSDFGLMREIYEDVYSGKNTKKLPVKWMAPESINDNIYTIKSDVWSFGILLWEMATMGGTPYPTLTNRELCQLLKTGYRMERPDMCCDEVYDLMSECWNEDPSSRPSFSDMIDRLEVIMTRGVPYCDFNKHDESRPYYNVPAKTDENSG